mgnify:CR=1 FL=1
MTKVLFVCHGNICRSVMAEYIFRHYISELGIRDMHVESRAVSNEETGNDIYPPAKRCLEKHHIPYGRHYARRITQKDYDEYDDIFVMDSSNVRRIHALINDKDTKIRKLLDRDVADPWYTGDFESTYKDLVEGIENYLKEKGVL